VDLKCALGVSSEAASSGANIRSKSNKVYRSEHLVQTWKLVVNERYTL
jgi:hypothetical protein